MVSFYGPRELKSVHLEGVIPVPLQSHVITCNIRPDASEISAETFNGNAIDRAGGIGPEKVIVRYRKAVIYDGILLE
jgi:hypothetical protein